MLHKTIKIDPASINEDKVAREILGAFLKKNPDAILCTDLTYTDSVFSHSHNQQINYTFQSSKNVVFRRRKDQRAGLRYEIVDKCIGFGANGAIWHSMGNLKFVGDTLVFKTKERAIKQTERKRNNEEYTYSSGIRHLHIKPLSYSKFTKYNFMTMKFFHGLNLHQIIKDETTDNPLLTTDQRLQLTIDILEAVQKQIHDHGLLHLDIKAENIIVTDDKKVKIIDYFYSQKIGASNRMDFCGTLITMPQEQFHFDKIYPRTVKTDNYAVGKTLAELWHANPLVNKTKPVVGLSEQITFFRYAKKNTEYDYTNFFSNGLSSEHVEQLKNMLENLTRAIPDERWSIQQAVASLRSIQAERNIGIRHQLSSKTARI